jgi:predicted Zn-dependent peptidase
VSQSSVETSTLPNGITVVTHALPELETVAIGIWVRAGARDEQPSENGIAHLLEHMAFKGTGRRSARDIAEEIEAAGGDINASTAMENTAYYARVLKDDWRLALDVLSDILIDPVFDPEELERERDVILQEIAAAHDTPDDLVFDLLQSQAWPEHPLGRPILGTAARVAVHDVAAITRYRDRHYAANRMVVAAAGDIDHRQLVAEAEALLAKLAPASSRCWQPPRFVGGPSSAPRPLDQTHIAFGLPGVSYHDPDVYTMQVLSGILGGGMSSRLFQELREERGLCYAVYSYASSYEDSGILTVYAATAPDKAGALVSVMSDVMRSLVDDIPEREVARARAQIKAGLVMNLESASGRADQIARQFLAFGRVPDIAELIARIDAVDASRVNALAARVLTGIRPAMAAVGAITSLAPYERIAARFT